MHDPHLEDTRPVRLSSSRPALEAPAGGHGPTQPAPRPAGEDATRPVQAVAVQPSGQAGGVTRPIPLPVNTPAPAPLLRPAARRKPKAWLWVLVAALWLGLAVGAGALGGYGSGRQARAELVSSQARLAVQAQFDLGVEDLQAGRYEVARQRFEYVLAQDPSFPGATEKLAQAMQVLFATATPTVLPPTVTPTPTRDLRPVEDLFKQAQSAAAGQEWAAVLDALTSLRKEDRSYQAVQADRLLYLALRQRGVAKILAERNLEGGIYDLAQAEHFGPLDQEAITARNWARLYIIGNSFWEAYPEQAVYYFNQVAAAAPNLRDASGWTAAARYRAALVQYGDLLAQNEDWCSAQAQYELALSMGADADLQASAAHAAEQCSPPTATPMPVTDTPVPPTATDTVPAPTQPLPPTATLAPPTDTLPPPTETQPAPTETLAPPTAEPPATATLAEPTATLPEPTAIPKLPNG